MDIPNWMRATLENVVSVVGAAFGALSVMKVFEAMGLKWAPALEPIVGLGDLPGEPLQKTIRSTIPESVAAAFSSYILMGLFFAWMTHRFARKTVTTPDPGYIKRAAQEAAIMVVTWPMRLASDLSNPIFWQLTPWYVGLMLAVAEILLAISLITGLARFGRGRRESGESPRARED